MQPESAPKSLVDKYSERLSSGWKLVQSVCPICENPLIFHPNDGTFCVACELPVRAESTLNGTPHMFNSKPTVHEAKEEPDLAGWDTVEQNEAWQRKRNQIDSASSIMGKKLLEGWAMLADQCPKCNSPLMKQKGTEETCVVCDANKTQQEITPQTNTNNQPKPPQQQHQQHASKSKLQPASVPHEETEQPPQIVIDKPRNRSPPEQPSRRRWRAGATTGSSSATGPHHHSQPHHQSAAVSSTHQNRSSLMDDPNPLGRNLSNTSSHGRFLAEPTMRQQRSRQTSHGGHVTYQQTETELMHQLDHTMYQLTRKLYVFNTELERAELKSMGNCVDYLQVLIRGMKVARDFRREISE